MLPAHAELEQAGKVPMPSNDSAEQLTDLYRGRKFDDEGLDHVLGLPC